MKTTTSSFSTHQARALLDNLDTSTNPKQRVQDAEDLAKIAQSIQREAIADARTLGHTWETIGSWLRITKQAAQQRLSR